MKLKGFYTPNKTRDKETDDLINGIIQRISKDKKAKTGSLGEAITNLLNEKKALRKPLRKYVKLT